MIRRVGGAVATVLAAQFRRCEVLEAGDAFEDFGSEGGITGEEGEWVFVEVVWIAGDEE